MDDHHNEVFFLGYIFIFVIFITKQKVYPLLLVIK